MFKRYVQTLLVGLLLCGVFFNASAQCESETAKDAQQLEVCVVATSGVCATYADIMHKYVAQLYARCKDYRELCGIGAAFICAYVVYKISSMNKKKIEIDFSDFEDYANEKGDEAA